MQWLVMSLALYLVIGWVRSTVERGKRRSQREKALRASASRGPAKRSGESRRRKAASPASTPKTRAPHEVLGVDEDAPLEVVQSRYRKLAVEYHPDKLASSAPELQAIASERLREINVAYAALLKARRSD